MYFKCQSISQVDQKLLMKNFLELFLLIFEKKYAQTYEDNETFFVTKQIASEK